MRKERLRTIRTRGIEKYQAMFRPQHKRRRTMKLNLLSKAKKGKVCKRTIGMGGTGKHQTRFSPPINTRGQNKADIAEAMRKRKEFIRTVGIRKTPNKIFTPRGGNKQVGRSSMFPFLVLLSTLFLFLAYY